MEDFDRTQPAYRCFDLTQEADGRDGVWYQIGPDKRVTRECTEAESLKLFQYVERQEWRDLFWTAYGVNKKATLYGGVVLV